MKHLLSLITALFFAVGAYAQDDVLYTAFGQVGAYAEWEDSFDGHFPYNRDVKVEVYDGYVIVRGMAGVDGYDFKVKFDEDENVTSLTPIVNGNEGEEATSDFVALYTGLSGNYSCLNAYIDEDYCNVGCYEDETGYVALTGYDSNYNYFIYYYIYWPQEELDPNFDNYPKAVSTCPYSISYSNAYLQLDEGTWIGLYINSESDAYVAGIKTDSTNVELPDYFTYPGMYGDAIIPITSLGRDSYPYSGYLFSQCPEISSITVPVNVNYLDIYFGRYSKLPEFHFRGGAPESYWSVPSSLTVYVQNKAHYTSFVSRLSNSTVYPDGWDFDWTVVNVAKPGEFAQTYLDENDNNWGNGMYVKITGTINDIDLKNIKNLTQLMKLDLSEAVFTETPREWLYGKTFLNEVILPSTVRTIGGNSFYTCSRLTKVVVAGESNIENIGDDAFYGCSSLIEVDAPTVRMVGNYAFQDCTSYDCPSLSWAWSIGTYALANTATSKVDGPAFFSPNLNVIPSHMFYGCTKLKEVNISDHITSIGDRAFYNCSSLENVTLPKMLTSIGSYSFYNTKINEIVLPDRLTSISSYAFNNCNNLTAIKCKAVTPPVASSSFINTNMTNVELFVPPFAVDAYRYATIWENFYKIRSLLEPIDYIHVQRPVEINISEEDSELLTNNPRIVITNYNSNTFGQLTINGEGTLSASVIDMYPMLYRRDNGRSTSYGMPTLINNADKMRTDSLSVHMTLSNSDYWYFITLPYDVLVKDIVPSADTYWVIRKYDSEARATGTGTTWVDLTEDDVMEAGKGYIVRAYNYNYSPQLTFPSRNTVTKNNIFRSTNVIVPLEEHVAEFAHNRSWNLIGNPYPAYFNTNMILDNTGETITAPITIWRGSSYKAYSPVDDDMIIRPYESFFIQRPLDQKELTFPTEGRMHFDEAYNASTSNGHGAFAPRRSNVEESNGREVFDFNITIGELDNRARIVLNEKAEMNYEVGRDAAKFFTVENNSPLLYVTADQSYEICERPMADGKATLGLQLSSEGLYTISLSGRHGSEWNVWLTDNQTGRTVNLAAEDYTFNGEQSADAKRFTVSFDNEATAIKSIESLDQNAQVTITTVGGVEVFKGRLADFNCPASGVYLVSKGGDTVKVAIQ